VSLFAPAPVAASAPSPRPTAPVAPPASDSSASTPTPTPAPAPAPSVEPVAPASGGAGTPHLLVRVGDTNVAFPVSDVREVLRSAQVRMLGHGSHELHGRPVSHVDVHGRTVPVVDLRTDPSGPGDVLLPLWRRHAGVVVDRVVRVLGADDLVVEPSAAVEALPAYAHGVGRTVDDATPVLLVALPELAGAATS
jgi:chemotaxis signal transduction protein